VAEYTSTVLVDGLVFPEAPRWRQGRLWFSDQHGLAVYAVTPQGELEKIVDVPGHPSGLGWMPDGTMLIVSMRDRCVMKLVKGELVLHADLSELATWHCNDMVVDTTGRAYVGNFGFDLDGGDPAVNAAVIIVERDGRIRVGADEMRFPNGAVITPDGDTLIVAETMAGQLTAFDIRADGSLRNQRLFARTEGAVPDGICLDVEGAVWIACPMTGRALRILEGGEITDVVTVSANPGAFAVALGGEDGRTLFICTAPSYHPDAAVEAVSGAIEFVKVTVAGAGLS
jgi:sugar lactone lactonase YvrE